MRTRVACHLVQLEQLLGDVGQLAEQQRRLQVDLVAQGPHHLLPVVAVGEHAGGRHQAVDCVADGPHHDPEDSSSVLGPPIAALGTDTGVAGSLISTFGYMVASTDLNTVIQL